MLDVGELRVAQRPRTLPAEAARRLQTAESEETRIIAQHIADSAYAAPLPDVSSDGDIPLIDDVIPPRAYNISQNIRREREEDHYKSLRHDIDCITVSASWQDSRAARADAKHTHLHHELSEAVSHAACPACGVEARMPAETPVSWKGVTVVTVDSCIELQVPIFECVR